MAPTNPQLERAKQGDPEAIAALMRRSLEPKGINVQAESGGDVLRVVLEGSQPVNREALLAFIRKGMLQLGVKGLRSIAVEWRQPGSLLTDWTDSISLDDDDPYSLDAVSMSQLEAPTPPPVDMDDLPMGDGGYGAESDQYDMADDSLDEEAMAPSAETSKPAKKSSLGGLFLLLGVVAIGGGLYYLYQKGELNSVVANLPPEVQTYLPPITPSAPAEPAITTDASPASSPAPEVTAPSPAPEATAPVAPPDASSSPAAPPAAPAPSPTAPAPTPTAPAPAAAQPNPDFAEAVRKAMTAAKLAQTARTKAEWTTVAAEWQAASALMQKVPADNPNFAIAQNRAPQYTQNAAIARTRAQEAP